jgi:hypothetical protein
MAAELLFQTWIALSAPRGGMALDLRQTVSRLMAEKRRPRVRHARHAGLDVFGMRRC